MKKIDIGLLLYLLLCLTLFSMMVACSSPRKTQTDTTRKMQVEAASQGTEQGNRAMIEKMMRQYEELLRIVTDKEVEQVRTELSAPDSTGVQYLTAVTHTRTTSRTTADQQCKKHTDTDTKAVEAVTVTRQDTLAVTSDEDTHTTEEVKRRLSGWQSALIFLGLGLVIYIGFKVYLKIRKT